MQYNSNPAILDRAMEMFTAVMEKPEIPETEKEQIRNDVAQLVEFFKRQDRVEYVVRLYRGLLGEKYALLLSEKQKSKYQIAGLDRSQIETVLEDLKHFLGTAEVHNITFILDYVFEGDKIPQLLVQELRRLERRHYQTEPVGKNLPLTAGKPLIQFADGYQWTLLDVASSDLEGNAMGHCGNASAHNDRTQKIISLRSINPGEKVTVEGGVVYGMLPHLTFILHLVGAAGSWGYLGEMKGRHNNKGTVKTCKPGAVPLPCEHHQYIVPLLAHPMIGWVLGGGYSSDANFHLSDLSPENTEKLKAIRPDLYDISKSAHIAELPAKLLTDSMEEVEESIKRKASKAKKEIRTFLKLINDLTSFSAKALTTGSTAPSPSGGKGQSKQKKLAAIRAIRKQEQEQEQEQLRKNDPEFMALASDAQLSTRLADPILTEIKTRLEKAFKAGYYRHVTALIKLGVKALRGTLTKRGRKLEIITVKSANEKRQDSILEAVKQHPEAATNRAVQILRKRWPEAEPYICQSPASAIKYYCGLIDEFKQNDTPIRWLEAEKYLITSPENLVTYLMYYATGHYSSGILKNRRIRELEPYLFADPKSIFKYWKIIPWATWKKAEPTLVKHFPSLVKYLKTLPIKQHGDNFDKKSCEDFIKIFPRYHVMILEHIRSLIQINPLVVKEYFDDIKEEFGKFQVYNDGDEEDEAEDDEDDEEDEEEAEEAEEDEAEDDDEIELLELEDEEEAEDDDALRALRNNPKDLCKDKYKTILTNLMSDIVKVSLEMQNEDVRSALIVDFCCNISKEPWESVEHLITNLDELTTYYHKFENELSQREGLSKAFLTDPQLAYRYARKRSRKRFIPGEPAILKDARLTSKYYREVFGNKPWPAAKSVFAKAPEERLEYIQNLKDRWEEVEEKLIEDLDSLKDTNETLKKIILYHKKYVMNRWPSLEKKLLALIANNKKSYNNKIYIDMALLYWATINENQPEALWPELEVLIIKDVKYILEYCLLIRKRWPAAEKQLTLYGSANEVWRYYEQIYSIFEGEKPWPEGEPMFSVDPEISLAYAKQLRRRFPKGEKVIASRARIEDIVKYALMTGRRFVIAESRIFSSSANTYIRDAVSKYLRFFIKETLSPELEEKIADEAEWAFIYAKYTIKGPFPKGEAAILASPTYAYPYINDVIQASSQEYADIEKQIKGEYGTTLENLIVEKRKAGLIRRCRNPLTKKLSNLRRIVES